MKVVDFYLNSGVVLTQNLHSMVLEKVITNFLIVINLLGASIII